MKRFSQMQSTHLFIYFRSGYLNISCIACIIKLKKQNAWHSVSCLKLEQGYSKTASHRVTDTVLIKLAINEDGVNKAMQRYGTNSACTFIYVRQWKKLLPYE